MSIKAKIKPGSKGWGIDIDSQAGHLTVLHVQNKSLAVLCEQPRTLYNSVIWFLIAKAHSHSSPDQLYSQAPSPSSTHKEWTLGHGRMRGWKRWAYLINGCQMPETGWKWAYAGLCVCVAMLKVGRMRQQDCVSMYTTTLISCTKSTPSCPFMAHRVSVWVSYFFGIDGSATHGLHNILVSHTHRQQTHSVSIVGASSCSGLSLEQPANPEAKAGQIGKTLREPLLQPLPRSNFFLSSDLRSTLCSHFIRLLAMTKQVQSEDQCLHPDEGKAASSSSSSSSSF